MAGALAWYARSRAILGAHRPDAVLVSSDSNPEELGFASAARALDVPTVFVSHAYTTPLSPPLDFSLSILEGEAAVRARRRKGPISGDIVLAGLEGDSAPLDRRTLRETRPGHRHLHAQRRCRGRSWWRSSPIAASTSVRREIVIRWHPSMLERPRLAEWLADMSGIVETPRTADLTDVAQRCDWVIADENSGVHLPVLKLGIPTIAVKNLGLYPTKPVGSVWLCRRRCGVSAGRHPSATSSPDALATFFSGGWPARFQHFDASYLRPPQAIGSEVRRAIWRLFESEPAKVTCA